MLETNQGPLTFLRFGIQRKKSFLRDVSRAYDGLVLPANVLLYQYRSTPSAVLMCGKPFFVDPMSYLFGQPYEVFKQRVRKGEPRFKPSFQRLMQGHGLTPEDFLPYDYTALLRFLARPGRNLELFVENTLGFEWNKVWETLSEAADLMTEEQRATLTEARFRPAVLIPPYFLHEPSTTRGRHATTELNRRILEFCRLERGRWRSLFPMVFLRKEHLQARYRQEIVDIYRRNEFQGYCIWVDEFDERLAKQGEISSLVELVGVLSEGGKQVAMLYGGFFSLLLYYFGMTAVCHGLAYGEYRALGASAQQGSGPAPIRYYVLELHCFLTLENALTVLRRRPDLLCNCPACRRVVRGDPERVTLYQDEEAMAEMHFLWCRNQERRMIGQGSRETAIENLEWTLELNDDIADITKRYRVNSGYEDRPIVDPAYIREWKNAMSQFAPAV